MMFDLKEDTLYSVRIEFKGSDRMILANVVDYTYGEFMTFHTNSGETHMIASESIQSIHMYPGDHND